MGLFDFIFPKKKDQPTLAAETFRLLSGYNPVWRSWGGQLYESELIRAAIDAKARHISKLDIVVNGTAKPGLQSKLKLGPNQWQTWSQFLYRLSTILDMQNTAIIVPVVDHFGDFPGGSDGKASVHNVGDPGSIPGWGRSLAKEMATHSSTLV